MNADERRLKGRKKTRTTTSRTTQIRRAAIKPSFQSAFICVHLRLIPSSVLSVFSVVRSSAASGADVDARGVAIQTFGFGERDDGGGVFGEAPLGVTFEARALEELVDAQAAGKARGGVGRQAVTRAGHVIASG